MAAPTKSLAKAPTKARPAAKTVGKAATKGPSSVSSGQSGTGTQSFEYVVRDASGRKKVGKMEARSEAALIAKLRASGQAPLSVKLAGQGLQREITLPFGNSVKTTDLAIMARQFATMVSSGLPLMRALSILADQTENKALAKVLAEVRTAVEEGGSLSSALARYPRVFPPLMVNMTRAGEAGGFLDQSLRQIAENFEAEAKLKAKVRSAMTYPVVVFCIAILAVLAMLIFIVPVFATMFSQLGAPLPGPTQLLVTLSHGLRLFGPVLLVLAVVGAVVWGRVKHRDDVRNVVDPIKLKVPVFGKLTAKIAISRMARNLGTMVRSGVPVIHALEIVAGTTGNVVVSKALHDCQDSVRNGGSLTGPLLGHSVIPPMVAQMMAVGEDTGALDAMLEKISEFYDEQVEATTDALTSLIEPLMITGLGAVVGGMIVALYMPIFSVFNVIQ
ncbi:type IV pilus assembly protein PilC [Quadrisphaera granulorum]|uniref:Type IV pilus assembly protein PilC n=1 Tax=Quadrisphaera granulorum TaxID=317664 RepID=A0A315ZS83_9ACTN|nr:type II secretion system F family protein [Quadrisphaera granulorum]PWJ47993.1 type IV pilus assembly protein PilC [Quadrisphaera granulorum]SZE98565.1 type IV pilus assembly protein PilC [Quadrisphaera granulorum]